MKTDTITKLTQIQWVKIDLLVKATRYRGLFADHDRESDLNWRLLKSTVQGIRNQERELRTVVADAKRRGPYTYAAADYYRNRDRFLDLLDGLEVIEQQLENAADEAEGASPVLFEAIEELIDETSLLRASVRLNCRLITRLYHHRLKRVSSDY